MLKETQSEMQLEMKTSTSIIKKNEWKYQRKALSTECIMCKVGM